MTSNNGFVKPNPFKTENTASRRNISHLNHLQKQYGELVPAKVRKLKKVAKKKRTVQRVFSNIIDEPEPQPITSDKDREFEEKHMS